MTKLARAALLGVCVLLASTSLAGAQVDDGVYAIKGKDAKGKSYKGTVSVATRGGAVLLLRQVGKTIVPGVGMRAGGSLYVAWGGTAGIVVFTGGGAYKTLDGHWATVASDGQVGTEAATRTGGDAEDDPGFEGEYSIAGTNPGSGSRYAGTLALSWARGTWSAEWKVGSSTYQGVGTGAGDSGGDQIGVAFGGEAVLLFDYRAGKAGVAGTETVVDPRDGYADEKLTAASGPLKTLDGLAALGCACKDKVCGAAGLAGLGSAFKRFATAEAPAKDLEKIEASSGKLAACLIKAGVTPEQLQAALQ